MDLGISGRTALIGGASRGLGFATAQVLADEGVNLILTARGDSALEQAASRLRQTGVIVTTVAADLATEAGLEAVLAAAADAPGNVDILVTNSGGPGPSPALAVPWTAWQQAAELLLRSAVELTRALVPGMRERGWGRVIGITSYAVKHPLTGLVLSNSLRAAVTGYFRTLANEVAVDGVTVNTVLPGYTATERLEHLATATAAREGITTEVAFSRMRAASPAGRLGQPEEVAATIAWLASRPAGFITGQAIAVDGGATGSLL